MLRQHVQYLVGLGGWEHESFNPCLYGVETEYSAIKLRYYARFFDAVEVRPTFWDGSLSAHEAEQWIDAVAENKRFRFNVKLHKAFTHTREFKPEVATRVRGLLEALQKAERLGALLIQLPYSFTNTSTNRFHLVKLGEMFRGFPMHVEFRHESWNQPNLMNFLTENYLAPVNADLPRLRQFMPFVTGTVGDTAYVRLHGRNEKGWLENGVDTRYDYLYNGKELREILRRLVALEEKCNRIMVIFNNTTGGKAVVNALQMLSILREGKPIAVPQAAVTAFPNLLDNTKAVVEDSLFAGEKLFRRVG
jgi:uncharacterized protein YecE (DUF72 family)